MVDGTIDVDRRLFLVSTGALAVAGTAAGQTQPPVVDNGGDDPSQAVTIDIRVVNADGEPVPDERVRLEDRGGTPDTRYGRTGPDGRLRFLEGVGPPPCNTQTVVLPDRGTRHELGCNSGGESVSHTFVVDGESDPQRDAGGRSDEFDTDYYPQESGSGSPRLGAMGMAIMGTGFVIGFLSLVALAVLGFRSWRRD